MIRSNYALVLGVLLPLCGCSSSNDSSTDGTGKTIGSGGDAGAEAGADDAATGASTPEACTAYIAYRQRCDVGTPSGSQACADGRKATCTARLATWSPAYAAAYATCTTSATSCNDGPDDCIASKLATTVGTPTAAQAKVRDDFCAACPSATCKDDFYKIDPTNGNGSGFILLEASDDVVVTIGKQCTNGGVGLDLDASAGDCQLAFLTCASDTKSSADPDDPDTCFPPDTSDAASE